MASDDGFREIQLSGKQLVFLFMATTIVAVVIFLCGVMVGRGVKGTGSAAAAAPSPGVPTPDAQPAADPQPATGVAPLAAKDAQPRAAESLSSPAADDQTKKGAPADEPPPAVPDEPPNATPAPAATPAAVAAAGRGEPTGDGFVVQVTALADQAQCNAIAARLVSKGYPAYVVAPPPGGGVYRVRVGKFKERREADTVKRRLEKEEQYKPWITR